MKYRLEAACNQVYTMFIHEKNKVQYLPYFQTTKDK